MNIFVANGPCQHCYCLLDEHLPDKKCLFSNTTWRAFPDLVVLEAVHHVNMPNATTIKFYDHNCVDRWYNTRTYRLKERDPLLTRLPLGHLLTVRSHYP